MDAKLIICMGVSGCGKSTLAQYIAEQIGADFIEADDYHPAENIALMQGGTPLTDADREPWIQALCRVIKESNTNMVMAYSRLKYEHRQRFLNLGKACLFLNLNINSIEVTRRLALRAGHFMAPSLIASQFAAMEEIHSDEPVKAVDSRQSLKQVQASAMQYVDVFMRAPEPENSSDKTKPTGDRA